MGRKPNWPPKLVRKPGTAEARTYHAGRWWTCGRWDVGRGEASPGARAAHARLVGRWLADPGAAARPAGEYLLAELLADWGESADAPGSRVGRERLGLAVAALGPLGAGAAAGFGPAELVAWRADLGRRLSRETVAAYTLPVLRAYQWGEETGRVPEGHAARLWAAVARRPTPGRGMRPRPPADPEAVAKVTARLARTRPDLAPLFRLHALTGARVQELLALTAGHVRRSGVLTTARGARLDLTRAGVWAADLGAAHKTAGSGGERVLVFGPKARAVLARVLNGKRGEDRLFPGVNRSSYHHAVALACRGAGVPHFAPRQLRQAAADRVRDELGAEHAAAYLGHAPRGVTQRHYLTVSLTKAAEAARAVG